MEDFNMKKSFKTLLLTGLLSLSMVLPAFAGSWQNDGIGSWYLNDDGSYPVNCWQWIDSNLDGIAESYYFNEAGYLLVNTTTPDNYTVDANGAWIVDGVVQTQVVVIPADNQTTSNSLAQDNTQAASTTQTADSATTSADTQTAGTHTFTGISSTPYDGYTIIANLNTHKYHVPTCRSVKDMKDHNKGYCSDAAYLDSLGYQPCKNCH